FENVAERLRVHALAIVRHNQTCINARPWPTRVVSTVGHFNGPRLDAEQPSMHHGVARLYHQVRQNLIDLRGVDLDLAKTIVEIQLEPRAADESPEDRLEAPYEGIELYHLQVQVLAPRERKQLPCQVPGTGGSALNRRGFLDHCRWQVLLEDLLGGRDND